MYEREDNEKCPDCNYPGIVNKGEEKGCGLYFGSIEGNFYTTNRKEDLLEAVREVLQEKLDLKVLD